jgi:hypothetical protein
VGSTKEDESKMRVDVERFSEALLRLEKSKEFWYLDETARILAIIGNQLQIDVVQAVAYKLWEPGLMTIAELSNLTGNTERAVASYVVSLVSLGVLEEKTRGIYDSGKYGQLLMNLFAWMVIEAKI